MAGLILALAIFFSLQVVVALLTRDMTKPSWMIGPDKHNHPNSYWALIGGLSLVAVLAWLRVAAII
jgi:hypothetical protein